MVSFVLKRLGFALVTLVSVLTLVFLIVRILPGDPVLVILGDQASPESAAALRARLGLDQTIPVQYAHFMFRAAQGDLGTAMVSGSDWRSSAASPSRNRGWSSTMSSFTRAILNKARVCQPPPASPRPERLCIRRWS